VPDEVDAESEAAFGVDFVVESRLERYMVVAGYGGWDDGTPSSTFLDRAIGRIITRIRRMPSSIYAREHTQRVWRPLQGGFKKE
jgi:hypothetical protein